MIEVALFGAGRIGSIHAANVARQPGTQRYPLAQGPAPRSALRLDYQFAR